MRAINYESLEVDGINFDHYPEFPDARICGGYTKDGWLLSDIEMDILSKDKYLMESLIDWRING